ncbi:MAG TPA: PP2C family protein-serine/threonine phosphatase [Candidatus Angelobacter sp.]|jgi:serine phosphatase RsbU (regulator of sigma subunit)
MRTFQTSSVSAEHIVSVIFGYATKISKEQDIAGLIRLNADLARDIVGAERCSLWLLDERTGELWTRVAHEIGEIRIPGSQGIVGACIAQGETMMVNEAQSDKRFLREVDNSSGYRTDSVLCVPLHLEAGVIGALQVLNKPNGFSQEDAEVVRLMGAYTAAAIQAEWLRKEAETTRLLKHELAIAANVQQQLFPGELAMIHGLEYTGFCRPAKFVGGDYYDFLTMPGDGFSLTLGDVSGKGLPAAVLMASIQTLLRALLRHNPHDLSAAIRELNDALYQSSTSERYSTLFCGALNSTRDQMTYVNAGHIPPFIVRKDGHIERTTEGDMPIGLMPSVPYRHHTIHLNRGDLIVCVSDGIVEAQKMDGELWEESRLESILLEFRHEPVRHLAERLIRGVDEFVGSVDQFDDITIIIIRLI